MSKVPPSPAQVTTVVSVSPFMSRAARTPLAVAPPVSKAAVDHGDLQGRLGIGPGDDGPAAGRKHHDRLFAQGLEHKAHGDGRAAARAAHMAGIHEFLDPVSVNLP